MSGLGFTEILCVGLIILIFFGSEDLPKLLRLVGEYWGKFKRFTNAAKAEINAVISDATPEMDGIIDETTFDEKQKIRVAVQAQIKTVSSEQKANESSLITAQVLDSKEWKEAASVMLFSALTDEPQTEKLIETALEEKKRVILPYCKKGSEEIGIAEIHSLEDDLVAGTFGILEPKEALRDNFFLSDVRLILCPGVAFSRDGYRLGRGKGHYTRFLHSVAGKVPLWGLCFTSQLRDESLPFDYNNILMDTVITPKERISKQ